MLHATVIVNLPEGLHARPAADFARQASLAGNTVMVGRMGGKLVRGDSILSLMTLGIKQGDLLLLEVRGPNAETLLATLKSLVSGPASN